MREVGLTILMLTLSNVFMTFAWYAHLKELSTKPWIIAVLASWGVALFEYLFQALDPVYWDELHAKIRALGPSAEVTTMTIAEMFEERGRVKGLEEGLIRGREEGRRASLRGLLIFKFQFKLNRQTRLFCHI